MGSSTSNIESGEGGPAGAPSNSFVGSWAVSASFGAAGSEEGRCAPSPSGGLLCYVSKSSFHPMGKLLMVTLDFVDGEPVAQMFTTTDDGATILAQGRMRAAEHPTTPSDLTSRIERDDDGLLRSVSLSATIPYGVYFSRVA